VVAFNAFNRWLKTITARTESLGHALVGQLRAEQSGSRSSLRASEMSIREVR